MPPVICFGQQPCGIFPRRFLYAKIVTARRLQADLGGRIVFFYHDSDHDPRETKTTLRHRRSFEPLDINFVYDNVWQKKYSPLYEKRVREDFRARTERQLPAYVEKSLVDAYRAIHATRVADFCLDMYRRMGLLDAIEVARSSDPGFRARAREVEDFFVDVSHEGEVVRARWMDGQLRLHKGGGVYLTLPMRSFDRSQVSPARDVRLRWMQSVIGCTHYVCGAGEQAYLRMAETPQITFVTRDAIDRSDEAYTDV